MAPPMAEAAVTEAILARLMSSDKAFYFLPNFLGGYLDSLLMGICICQLYIYWPYAKKDKIHIVATVYIVGLLTAMASVMILLWELNLFVWGFAAYLQFIESRWLVRYMSVELATVVVVQAFYIDRACRLWKHYWPVAVMGPCLAAVFALGIAAINSMAQYEYLAAELTDNRLVQTLAYSWMSFILLTDALITVIIAVSLFKMRTGVPSTDTALRRLLIRVFETQLPALIFSFVTLIMWNRRFDLVLSFTMLQSKVFALGLLITLNLRAGHKVEVNVSYPSAGPQPKETHSYPLGRLSVSTDSKHIRQSSAGTPKDIEIGHPDNHSGILDTECGSSVGLHQSTRAG